MHHLPRFLFKKMDQVSSPNNNNKPKLFRKNAAKNFDYTPSSSTSPTPGAGPRRQSVDLSCSADMTSFRVEGNSADEVDLICQNIGISLEDLEMPRDAFITMKDRSSSDVTPTTKKDSHSHSHSVEPIKPLKQQELPNKNEVSDIDCGAKEFKPASIPPLTPLCVGVVGVGGGIKGHRPPLLTPPPAMSLPVLDDGCSTWDLFNGLAPDNNKPSRFGDLDLLQSSDDEEQVNTEANHSVRIGETVILSGSCSFTTTNDDDSSSSTTEPVSIISPNGVCKVDISEWEKGALLGRGSFGSVYEGISCEGFFFAVKEVSLLEQGSQGRQSVYQLEQEIELLSQFEHENIVRYLGTKTVDSKLYIFLELVTQGSLAKLYQQYSLRDSHVSAYTRQILQGLKYLHDRNVVHRDIKSANILVASNGTVKLADFGLAKATRLNDLKSCKGTAFWMAPEVVNHKNKGYGLPADIWSLGCTVLEMLTGHLPYYPLEFMQALFRIGKGVPPTIPDNLSSDARDFIQQCIRVNPNDRPTAAELLEHQFVRRPPESPMMRGRSI